MCIEVEDNIAYYWIVYKAVERCCVVTLTDARTLAGGIFFKNNDQSLSHRHTYKHTHSKEHSMTNIKLLLLHWHHHTCSVGML